jgi:hypothetical protein
MAIVSTRPCVADRDTISGPGVQLQSQSITQSCDVCRADLFKIGPGPSSSHTVGPMRDRAFSTTRESRQTGGRPRRRQTAGARADRPAHTAAIPLGLPARFGPHRPEVGRSAAPRPSKCFRRRASPVLFHERGPRFRIDRPCHFTASMRFTAPDAAGVPICAKCIFGRAMVADEEKSTNCRGADLAPRAVIVHQRNRITAARRRRRKSASPT